MPALPSSALCKPASGVSWAATWRPNRRHCGQNPVQGLSHSGTARDLRKPSSGQLQAQPRQMHVRGSIGETAWLPGFPLGNRGQSRQDISHQANGGSQESQGCAASQRVHHRTRTLRIKAWDPSSSCSRNQGPYNGPRKPRKPSSPSRATSLSLPYSWHQSTRSPCCCTSLPLIRW